MNTTMWEQPATQRNIEQLKKDGVHFVEPVAGELRVRRSGRGSLRTSRISSSKPWTVNRRAQRRGEEEDGARTIPIRTSASSANGNDLAGEKFLITVGGTREAIDPVRFISNHSSGKMGFAVAEAAAARGAEVTVVAGVTTVEPPADVKSDTGGFGGGDVRCGDEGAADGDRLCRSGGGRGLRSCERGRRKDQKGRPRYDDARAEKNAGHSRRCFETAHGRVAGRRICGRN